MKCPKCGVEYSDKVWRIHVKRCEVVEEIRDDATEDEIRSAAKEASISHWWTKSVERLEEELGAL